jgi:enamine deaminase RidA (YjgF/YER057c/UK114 family)
MPSTSRSRPRSPLSSSRPRPREYVVQTTVYVKALRRHFDAVARLHAEYFGPHRPTRTVLGVADLALPPQLMEIAAVAIVPEGA